MPTPTPANCSGLANSGIPAKLRELKSQIKLAHRVFPRCRVHQANARLEADDETETGGDHSLGGHHRPMKDSATFGTTPIINDPIISFYKGEGPDSCGRYIEEVWNFNYAKLEAVHDFIQWLFPLPKRSAFNPDAPLLTEQTAQEFSRSDLLRFRLNRSFKLMLGFYGLKSVKDDDGNLRIVQSVDFLERSRVWLFPNNHNHLRLTRILESVRLLGLEQYSRALLSALELIAHEHPKCVPSRTVEFWRSATAG